jgi:hypothetical protein
MGVGFSVLVYQPNYDVFAVSVTFLIIDSIGTGTQSVGRGIFTTRALNVLAEGASIYSDQETILDIREAEFATLPTQGDHVDIPADCNGVDQGEWVIKDHSSNGGGETTLILEKWVGAPVIQRLVMLEGK